jgi:hypothetical protein
MAAAPTTDRRSPLELPGERPLVHRQGRREIARVLGRSSLLARHVGEDRRKRPLALTAKGRALIERVGRDAHRKHLAALDRIPPARRARLDEFSALVRTLAEESLADARRRQAGDRERRSAAPTRTRR